MCSIMMLRTGYVDATGYIIPYCFSPVLLLLLNDGNRRIVTASHNFIWILFSPYRINGLDKLFIIIYAIRCRGQRNGIPVFCTGWLINLLSRCVIYFRQCIAYGYTRRCKRAGDGLEMTDMLRTISFIGRHAWKGLYDFDQAEGWFWNG